MSTILEDDWVKTLPAHIQEAMDIMDDSLNDFAGNVRMAQTITKLAFRRAMEGLVEQEKSGEIVEMDDDNFYGPADITPAISDEEVNARLAFAMKANKETSKLKEQRIRIMDEFSGVRDLPKPANVNFVQIRPSQREVARRMDAIGFHEEAKNIRQEAGIEVEEA